MNTRKQNQLQREAINLCDRLNEKLALNAGDPHRAAHCLRIESVHGRAWARFQRRSVSA